MANRKTPLSILFCLLAMITATPTEGAPLRKLRIWALELLALLSKTTSLFIGPVLLILDGLLNGRRVWRRLPFYGLLAATALLVMFVSMVKAGQVDAYSAPLPKAQRLRESWYALGYHLGLISFLHTPSPIHIPTHRPPLFAPMVDLLPLAYLAIGSLLYWRFRALRLLMLVSWAWVLFSALPGLNLIPLRRYLGDTYAYAPLIGVSWILGACLERIVRTQPGRKRRLAMGGAAAGVLLTMSLGSLNASAAWRDGVHLWRYVEELYPGSPQVCHAVGKAQIKQKRPGPALSQLIRCSRKWPDVSFAKHIGMALLELNRVDEAEQVFLRLVQEGKGDAHVRANLESIRAFKAQQR